MRARACVRAVNSQRALCAYVSMPMRVCLDKGSGREGLGTAMDSMWVFILSETIFRIRIERPSIPGAVTREGDPLTTAAKRKLMSDGLSNGQTSSIEHLKPKAVIICMYRQTYPPLFFTNPCLNAHIHIGTNATHVAKRYRFRSET